MCTGYDTMKSVLIEYHWAMKHRRKSSKRSEIMKWTKKWNKREEDRSGRHEMMERQQDWQIEWWKMNDMMSVAFGWCIIMVVFGWYVIIVVSSLISSSTSSSLVMMLLCWINHWYPYKVQMYVITSSCRPDHPSPVYASCAVWWYISPSSPRLSPSYVIETRHRAYPSVFKNTFLTNFLPTTTRFYN